MNELNMSELELMNSDSPSKKLPDVSRETRVSYETRLDRVGMGAIEMPLKLKMASGEVLTLTAKVDAFVSLDDVTARGIHMSRLYLELHSRLLKESFNLDLFKRLLKQFVDSQSGISKESHLKISFELPLQRPALKSSEVGYRQYPVEVVGAYKDGSCDISLMVRVLYSSTCPCSAALARELVKESLEEEFAGQESVSKKDLLHWLSQERAMGGVPHAQRSDAEVRVKLSQDGDLEADFVTLIDGVEKALGTPVQAAVKRADEQEFSRLNAKNLMYCEDAARKIKAYLDGSSSVKDYFVKVEHRESLHPHDAVAITTKGVPGGF